MPELRCLSDQDLRDYLLGRLPERVGRSVATHLEVCPDCDTRARRLDLATDPLVERLRRALMPAPPADETPVAAVASEKAGTAAPPARLGAYRILNEVGRGGMAVVYRARQDNPARVVAVKVLLAGSHSRGEWRARFRAEADTIARLRHAHIVQVFEAGEHDGLPFLALEFCEGGSLTQRLGGTPQPGREAAALVAKLALAVEHAHRAGVIHRDLKPANVLLTGEGEPKVSDFGLAKQEEAAGLTATGAVLGTPSYMAPEQAAGENATVGPATDVYALGAILYEMLTGQPPFRGANDLETLDQVRRQEPVAPGRLQGATPRDLETICLKCLRKEPRQRYATAGELADDLRRFLADLPVRARRSSAGERLRRWARRNPALAGLSAALAGLLLVVAVGASLLSLELHGALERTRVADRQTQRRLLDSLVAQARAVQRGRRSGQRVEALALLDQAADLARELGVCEEVRLELRNVAIAALAVPDLYPAQTWDGFPPDSMQMDFDERLEIYARTDESGNCSVRRVDGDVLVAYLQAPRSGGRDARPALSRDGRFLVVKQPGGATRVWELGGAGARLVLDEPEDVFWIDFHPKQPRVAFSHLNGRVTVWDLPAGRKFADLPADTLVRAPVIALHPTEPLVAITSYYSRTVQVRDLRTRAVVKSLELPGGGYHVAWHPAGHTLAATEGDGSNVHLFDRATFQCQRTFGALGWGGLRLCYNAAGDRLAVYGWLGEVGLFDASTGQPLFPLPPHRIIPVLRFDADGRRLAGFVQGRRLGVWQVGEGREYRPLRRSPKAISESSWMAVFPDGRLVAAGYGDGIAFWDLDAGTQVDFVRLENPFGFVDFEASAGGALLLGDESGLYRCPVGLDSRVPGRWRIGPPQSLGIPLGHGIAQSRDGRVMATALRPVSWYEPWAGGWVRHTDRPDRPLHLEAGADVRGIVVSPDGKWVVTSNGRPGLGPVKLFDAHTGRLERTLPAHGVRAQFSPDGRWLAVGDPEGSLLAVGSWEERQKLSGWGLFSPDSRMLVVRSESGHTLHLYEPGTDREFARLEDPNLDLAWNAVFTPDGSRLLVAGALGIHVWDLRRIRAELARRDLDWDALPYPPVAAPAVPLSVEFDMGDFHRLRPQRLVENFDRAVGAAEHLGVRWYLRGKFHQKAGRYAEARRDLRAAVGKQPNRALFCNGLARFYVLAPEQFRDADAAVSLAEKAVRVQPGDWAYVNTQGIAYYRIGRHADAAAAFQKCLAGGGAEAEAANLYFLALCRHRLGEAAKARECFDRARASQERQGGRLSQEEAEELQGFRTEAEATLAQPSGLPRPR
jgi:serine/threonine protein kinase/WD40 repeat protein/Flp pilus assembly protein TadD